MIVNTDLPLSQKLYEKDFYEWIQTTVKQLKEQRFNEIDLLHLIEEIETMGKSEKREIKNRLEVLIEHLLKLMYWESEKSNNARGWRITIIEQRNRIEDCLQDSPSLRPILAEMFLDCYQRARKDTLKKYELPSNLFPVEPPFTLEDVLNPDYFQN